jgi:glycerate 2-kinase
MCSLHAGTESEWFTRNRKIALRTAPKCSKEFSSHEAMIFQNETMRVLIAPDKFKGTLTAERAAWVIARGWQQIRPADDCQCVPISDGGEGFLDSICGTDGLLLERVDVTGPAGGQVSAMLARGNIAACLETSQACGLHLLKPEERDPARTSTRGVGELLLSACADNPGKILVGLGGSGTNDAGTGLARALGFRFLDSAGLDLPEGPASLIHLARIVKPSNPLSHPQILVGCDVDHPLLGPNGCTRVFGPQKGLRESDLSLVESGLKRLVEIVKRDLGFSEEDTPGSGAAGGLGYGFLVFCDAKLVSGFDLVAGARNLQGRIRESDLVITGEGSLDRQSLGGKAPVALARMAAALGKPVLCIAGNIEEGINCDDVFLHSISLSECAGSSACARSNSEHWLHHASKLLAKRRWNLENSLIHHER